MATTVQFVDSIASSPTVRLDLNTDPWMVTLDQLDLSPPPLRRTIAATMLMDGANIPASAYDNRLLRMHLELVTSTQDLAAIQLQTLARELNRPTNILKYQPGTTAPVFFRTFRSPDFVWTITKDSGSAYMSADVEIIAEPFAYGLLETPVSAATLATNPASANGNFLDVTGVKGDVESPALIRWPSSAVVAERESLFAVRRRGTPSAAPFLFQAEAMTQSLDTTTQANDANFSGAGNNYSRCTFATVATMQARLFTLDLGTASVDLRGRYRVFARYRKNTSGDAIGLRIQWGTSSGEVTTNDTFATPNVATLVTADLGEIQIPGGWDPVTNFRDGVQVAVTDTYYLEFQAARTSGSGTLDIDYLILVPADDRFGIVKWMEAGPDRWWLDAHDNTVHARNSSDHIATSSPPRLAGGLPMLAPNQTNRVYMVYEIASGLTTTLTTITVTISYFPRYLAIRPSAT